MIPAAFTTIRNGTLTDLSLPHDLYPASCIQATIATYQDHCTARITTIGDTSLLSLRVLPDQRVSAREILWAFLTDLLSRASIAHTKA